VALTSNGSRALLIPSSAFSNHEACADSDHMVTIDVSDSHPFLQAVNVITTQRLRVDHVRVLPAQESHGDVDGRPEPRLLEISLMSRWRKGLA
jgi:hypothetical protein